MAQQSARIPSFRLRQELFAVQICPWTQVELMRGVLRPGMRVEIPEWVIERARSWKLSSVTIHSTVDEESPTSLVMRVNVDALLHAIGADERSDRRDGRRSNDE